MTQTAPPSLLPLMRNFGAWAAMAGGLALVLVFVQIALPMMHPQPSAPTQIGEMAGEMARAAWRSFRDLPPPQPDLVETGSGAALFVVIPILGVLALLLAAISSYRREAGRLAIYGAGLGAAAILAHFVLWLALAILGMMLLIAIVQNLGDFFDI